MKIPSHLKQYVSSQVAKEERLAAAKGGVALPHRDLVMTLFLLGYDKEGEVAAAARKSFAGLPSETLFTALEGDVEPLLLKTVALTHGNDEALLTLIALHPDTDEKSLAMLAVKGPAPVAGAIAENRELLAAAPPLLDALRRNPHLSKETIDGAEALLNSPEGEERSAEGAQTTSASPPETPGGQGGEQKAEKEEEEKSVFEKVKDMNVADKVKAALLGNKEMRDILIKDNNNMISANVLRNPRITDEELIRVANARESSDQMLRVISSNKKHLKNYAIRLGLATNPKTPLHYSLKFMSSLHAKDIKSIAKSKNVPSSISKAARRIMERKKIS